MATAKVVLITGAASGIGAATARAFAARGDHVVLADVDPHGLGAIDTQLASCGSADRLTVTVDLTDVAAVEAMIKEAIERFGSLDVVHANAGICPPERPLTETSPELVDKILAVNVTGTVNTLRAAVPAIRDGGSVVITASDSGLLAHPGAAVYAASKIALIGLGRSLAAELGPRRIRVNMVCPGGVDTPLTRGVYGAKSDQVIEEYGASLPLGRIAMPEDIARAVVFLADAEHVTGVSLRVDGGDGLMGAL
jgi:3-oxoacyl-[acyl-carrier protein] reductase